MSTCVLRGRKKPLTGLEWGLFFRGKAKPVETFSALSSKQDRILVSLIHFACSQQVFWLHRPTSSLPITV
jgi:hypothetical protein